MGRLARVIAVGVAHHVTQRGNGRRFLLESDVDRRVYLDLLRENLALHKVLLVGYCLMSNHVHLIVIPADAEGLALSMKHTHGRYASYWNLVHNSSGHAWQRRSSMPAGSAAFVGSTALHGTESGASAIRSRGARLGMVERRCSLCNLQAEAFLSMELWQDHWISASWRDTSRQGKRKQSWPRSASARIRAGLWAHKSSSTLWKSR